MASLNPEALKRERKTAGLTQKELAKESGVAYSTLTKLEQGKIPSPSVTAIHNIAGALGCTVADLIDGQKLQVSGSDKVKFVYFDIGGVLVHWLPSLHTFAERIHRPYDAVLKLFHEYNGAVCRGNMTAEEFKLLCLLKLGVDVKDGGHDRAMQSWITDMRPVLPTHELIKEVSNHHQVGLLTNLGKGYFEEFIDRELVPEIKYKTVVKSCDLGLVKPEHEMYAVATEAAGVDPGEILFVDDSKVNVKAATDFGWHAEWFDEYDPHESISRIVKRHFSAKPAA